MFLLVLLAAGVIATPVMGGRLSRLTALRFRGVWLLQLSLLVQIVLIYVGADGSTALGALIDSEVLGGHTGVHLATYAGAAGFVWRNRTVPGMRLIGLGGGANLAAIIANGGVMPTLPSAATLAGLPHAVDGFQNSAVSSGSAAWFLGDVFAIPAGVPLANVFSVGDVLLLAAGLLMVWVTCGATLGTNPRRTAAVTA